MNANESYNMSRIAFNNILVKARIYCINKLNKKIAKAAKAGKREIFIYVFGLLKAKAIANVLKAMSYKAYVTRGLILTRIDIGW